MREVAEAADAVMSATGELSESYQTGLLSEDLDGMLFDHPIRVEEYDDVPTIRSLK